MSESAFVTEKLILDYAAHMLMLLHSLQDFTCIAFKGLLSGVFVHLKTRHIVSKSFKTLHTSPYHGVLVKKLSVIKFGSVMIHWIEVPSVQLGF